MSSKEYWIAVAANSMKNGVKTWLRFSLSQNNIHSLINNSKLTPKNMKITSSPLLFTKSPLFDQVLLSILQTKMEPILLVSWIKTIIRKWSSSLCRIWSNYKETGRMIPMQTNWDTATGLPNKQGNQLSMSPCLTARTSNTQFVSSILISFMNITQYFLMKKLRNLLGKCSIPLLISFIVWSLRTPKKKTAKRCI